LSSLALKQLFSFQSLLLSSFQCSKQYETPLEGNMINQEIMLKRQEEEMMQLQARMALRQSRLSLYPGDTIKASMLDITRDPLREIALETAMTQRKLRVS
jgi:tyrosine-protein phosphatase non-receptor type 13 protein